MAERKKVSKLNLKKKTRAAAAGQRSVPNKTAKAPRPAKSKAGKNAEHRAEPVEQIVMTADENGNRSVKKDRLARTAVPRETPKKSAVSTSPSSRTRTPQKRTAPRKKPSTGHTARPPADTGPNLSVVLGNKLRARRKRLITLLISFVVILAVVLFSVLTPTGPFEKISNTVALIGKGSFPISVIGTEVKSLQTVGSKVFLLSNSHFTAYNTAGKPLIEFQHNFSNPVLETSAERCLVYNRESTGFMISNNSRKLYEQETEYPIFCADLADCGSVAFATKASGYAAQVQVFARGMKRRFSWYLVDGLISDVALSENGKYLAVSVLKVKGGVFSSEIHVFRTDSEKELFTLALDGESAVKLETLSNTCFACVTNENISLIEWSSGAQTKADSKQLSPAFFKTGSHGALAVFSENSLAVIACYGVDGKKLSEFEYQGLIDDISVFGNTVYIQKGTQITALDRNGNLLGNTDLKQAPIFIAGVSGGVLTADNLQVMFHKT